jgi:hypothetical protein
MNILTELNFLNKENKFINNIIDVNNSYSYQNLFVNCYYCENSTHVIVNCPLFCSSDNFIFICIYI